MDSVLTISCPSCSRQLKLPATAKGKNVKCPVCSTIFLAEFEETKTIPLPALNPAAVTSRPPPLPEAPFPREESRPSPVDEPPVRRSLDGEEDRSRRRRDYDDDEDWGPRRRRRSSYDDDDYYEDDRAYRRRERRMEDAASLVAGPAITLIVLGFIELFAGLFFLIIFMVASSQNNQGQGDRDAKVLFLVFFLFGFIWGGLILTGGFMMKMMKSYGLAMTAAIMALVPFPCGIFNVGLGVWAIVSLSDGDVKRAFDRNTQ